MHVAIGQAQPDVFGSQASFGSSDDLTQSVAVGDMNSDGLLDIVVGNDGQSKVFHNQGRGNFSAQGTPYGSSGDVTQSVAVGDINGDGLLDIVAGNRAQSKIYLNQEGGKFSAEAIPLGRNDDDIWGVAVGDLDGDGRVDIVAGKYSGQDEIHFNEGNGAFSAPLKLSGGISSAFRSIAIGDLDSDGLLDIVASNGEGPNKIYLNRGGRSFHTPAITLGSGNSNNIYDVAIGDLDSDGLLDIVVGRYAGQNEIYYNQGGAKFPAVGKSFGSGDDFTQAVAVGDLDGNGWSDIVAINDTGQSEIYLNRGGRNIDTAPSKIFGPPYSYDEDLSVALGDLDGDGLLDIVAGNDGKNEIYINQGGEGWLGPGKPLLAPSGSTARPATLAIGDLNRDKLLDVVYGNMGRYLWYVDDGFVDDLDHGYLSDELRKEFGNNGAILGDGVEVGVKLIGNQWTISDSGAEYNIRRELNSDVLSVYEGGQNEIYLNQGDGKFPSKGAPFGAGSGNTLSIAIGDLNGDYLLDIVAGNAGLDEIYLNQGDGKYPSEAEPLGGNNDDTGSVAVGDLNADGWLDIVVGNFFGQNEIYLNEGDGEFPSQGYALGPKDSQTSSVAIGDLDGDLQLDIAVGNITGQNEVYFNQGGGKFPDQGWPLGLGNAETLSIALNDLNSDGLLDVIVGNRGQSEVYFNQGGGHFPQRGQPFGSSNIETYHIAAGDLNSDGLLDIVTGSTGENTVLLNRGAGDFSVQEKLFGPTDYDVTAVAVGDLNSDGMLDIVTNSVTNNVNDESNTNNDHSYIHVNRLRIADSSSLGGLDLAVLRPSVTANAGFYSEPVLLTSTEITVPLSLFDPQGRPVGHVEAQYAVNGDGAWRNAEPVAITDTLNLTTGYQVQVSQVITQASPVNEGSVVAGTLVVSDSHNVDELEVWVSLSHPRVNDLYARLISPSDDSVDLFHNVDVTGTEMRGTVFDDHSPITVTKTITEGEAPYSSRYRPDASLSIFNGKPMTGTWTLLIEDTGGRDRVILDAWGLNIATPPAQHVFRWNTLKSGFFGRSDNVVIRMIAYPQAPMDAPQAPGSYLYHNATAGPFLRPFAAATTFPFRVQGTQIRVMDGHNGHSEEHPIGDATAVRLRQGTERNAQPFTTSNNVIALSNLEGFVQSPGEVYPGDSVAAIWPVAGMQAITTHTPLRRYVVTDTVFVPPGQTVESTLSISDVRRMGTLEVTVGFALTPTTSTVGLAFALVDPAGNEISLVEPAPGPAAEVRAGISPTVAMTVGITHYNLAFRPQGATAMPLLPPGSPPLAPIALTMAPSATERLEALTGRMVNGDWTLRVTNPTADTEALLSWWGLNTRLVNLYYGSASPNDVSLDMQGVITGGVQTVRITDTAPLLIFDLDVALEWDARQDDHFMRQLESDLRRTSDFLFDWTNGQLALGTITVYHDAKMRAADYPLNPWLEADIRIFATNRLRPSAVKGGIVSEPVTDTVTLEQGGKPEEIVYHPGRVHMGAVWNRFGRSDTNLGEDWPRTLAHELGHYLLFLDDNYVGLDDSGMLIPVDECPGAMADHYRDGSDMRTDYGEFHPKTGWDKDCGATLSEQRSGRSDWETIKRWYPQLIAPGEGGSEANPGPRIQPLGITQVQFAALSDAAGANTLAVPYFYVLDKAGQPSTSARDTRVFLLTGDNHWLVDLGRPEGSLIQARGVKHYKGATNPDVLCAYRATKNEFACLAIELGGKDEIQLQAADTPLDIRVSPVSSTTVSIAANGLSTDIGPLTARFFSPDYPATLTTTLNYELDYSETVTLPVPSLRGYVVVWSGKRITDTKSLAVADFSLGGNPALQYVWANAQEQVWGNTMQYVWANRTRFGAGLAYQYVWANTLQYVWSGALQYVWSGAYQYVWANAPLRSYAPAISNDGQVMIYSPSNLGAADGEFITLQSSSQPPPLPGFATLIGEPYRLTATAGMSLTDASITMSYVRSDVNAGEEAYLRVYYCGAGCGGHVDWQPLPTQRSDISNQVSAPLQGPGYYALMSSIEVPLAQGWNQIGYPLTDSSAITNAMTLSAGQSLTDVRAPLALQPLATVLSAIYHYDPAASSEAPWLVYGPLSGTTGIVATLDDFAFAEGYLIYATQPITLLMTGSGAADEPARAWNRVSLNSPALPVPPAVYVADLPGSGQVLPIGVEVSAAGQICTSAVLLAPGHPRPDRFVIMVYANDPPNPQCFAAGQKLKFVFILNGKRYVAEETWDNTAIRPLAFALE